MSVSPIAALLGGGSIRKLSGNLALSSKMTIVTIMTKSSRKAQTLRSHDWSIAEAKAKLSEVIERARLSGPQTITRNGRRAVVVVAAEEWERKTKRRGHLAEFFAASPLRRSGLNVTRRKDAPRKVDL